MAIVRMQTIATNKRVVLEFLDRRAAIRFVSYMTMKPVKAIESYLRCFTGSPTRPSFEIHRHRLDIWTQARFLTL